MLVLGALQVGKDTASQKTEMSLATIIAWYVKAQNKKIKNKITKDASPNIPALMAIFDIFRHFNHNWRTQQQRQNCIREAHLYFGQKLHEESICKMKGCVNHVASPPYRQVVSRCWGTWCGLLISTPLPFTSHLKCPTPSQPIQAHCKQSSCSVTLWYLRESNSLDKTLLQDLSLKLAKERLNLPPLQHRGTSQEKSATNQLRSWLCTLCQEPPRYLSTMRTMFLTDCLA